MIALVWVDQNRRYFIANAVGIDPGEPMYRVRWRQVQNDPYADAVRKHIKINQPKVVEVF